MTSASHVVACSAILASADVVAVLPIKALGAGFVAYQPKPARPTDAALFLIITPTPIHTAITGEDTLVSECTRNTLINNFSVLQWQLNIDGFHRYDRHRGRGILHNG